MPSCQDEIVTFVPQPPPPSDHAVSDFHGPPALAVTRSVPPTPVTKAEFAGHGALPRYPPLSPVAWKKLWPCAPIFSKYGSSVLGSAGPHVHEELRFNGNGVSVDMAPNRAVSLLSLT